MNVNDSTRLSYALITEKDVELLYQLDQSSAVMKYINGGKKTSMAEILNVYLPRLKLYTKIESGWGLWKVTIKANQEFIGWVLVRPMGFFSESPEFDNLEIGWRFMQSSWGKGYATEAALAVLSEVEKHDSVKKLSALAIEENYASIAIMKKLGLSYVKTYLHKDSLGDIEAVYYQKQLVQSKQVD